MPTYVYRFVHSNETIEVQQAFTDDTLTEAVHPGDGTLRPVRKVFTPVGVTFKGSGFYKTDSKGGSKSSSSGAGSSTPSSESGSSDSTPASTPSPSGTTSGGSGDSSSSTSTAPPAATPSSSVHPHRHGSQSHPPWGGRRRDRHLRRLRLLRAGHRCRGGRRRHAVRPDLGTGHHRPRGGPPGRVPAPPRPAPRA